MAVSQAAFLAPPEIQCQALKAIAPPSFCVERTLVDRPAKPVVVRFCDLATASMADDWRKLTASLSQETDSEKLRALIDELIQTLGQEQKHVREEIEERIRRHVRDMEKKGLDPSLP